MDRRETKRQVIALRTMLRSNDLSAEQRNAMSNHILELRSKLDSAESHINPNEIAKRRDFLQKNKGMLEIFNTFWVILLGYTTDGYLSKEGYGKFHHAIDIALAGQATFLDVDQASVDADWTYDKLLYGSLNKTAFFDMLFEVIETWTEIVDPTYYAAFAWTLLDSVADTSVHPPRLRPHREMRCITKVENEASMIKNYVKNKKIRAALSIESDMMQRVPEVQKRLHDRKRGVDFDSSQLSMVEALGLHASNTVDFSDSDGESLNSVVSLHQQLALQQASWKEGAGWEEREEDDILMDDDLDDEQGEDVNQFLETTTEDAAAAGAFAGGGLEFEGDGNGEEGDESRDGLGLGMTASRKAKAGGGGGGVGAVENASGGQVGKGSGYRMRRSTASFMAYCQGRRETRVALNGLLGGDTGSSISGSLTTSLGSSHGLDFSAIAMLPSSMASISTETETSSALSGMDLDSPRSQHSTLSNNVLHIPSPSNKLQGRTGNAVSPFGGAVGDKARFSQFLASGKRLGSFAREYLHTHQISSGVAIDPLTGGSEAVHQAINSERTLANAMKLTKASSSMYTLSNSSSNLNLLSTHQEHPHQKGKASHAPLSKSKNAHHSSSQSKLPSSSRPGEHGMIGSASFGDLNLMGKSMYVPKTSSKNKGAYLYVAGHEGGIASVKEKEDSTGLSAYPSVASMNIPSIKTVTVTETGDDDVSECSVANPTTAMAATRTNNGGAKKYAGKVTRSESKDADSPMAKPATISAKVSGKKNGGGDRGGGSSNGNKEDESAAANPPNVATAVASAIVAGSAVTIPEGEEFGEVVEDGTSKFFNVLDTQVTATGARPYYAPEVVDKKNTAARSTNKKVNPERCGVSDLRGRKELIEGSRGAFLVVESSAPPVDPERVVQRVRLQVPDTAAAGAGPAGANISTDVAARVAKTSTSPTNHGSRCATSSRDSEPPTARKAFTRANTSEIPAPDITVAAAPVLSPAQRFDTIFAQAYSHTGQLKVANITYPLSHANVQQNCNASGGGGGSGVNSGGVFRPRANSNISYADSDVSFETQHIKEMEFVYNQYGDFRLGGGGGGGGAGGGLHPAYVSNANASPAAPIGNSLTMPTMHRRFHGDASTSVETIFSDTLSSPPLSAMHPAAGRYNKVGVIPPSIVLDPNSNNWGSRQQHQRGNGSPSSRLGVDLEKSGNLDSESFSSQYPNIKRGTNLAILPPRQHQQKQQQLAASSTTFPQSMYYNVVKTALDLRQQPNWNPSWDHTRASKKVRLSSLRKPVVDVSLSLTTAPMNIGNAKKLEEVIKDTDHQRRILSGAIDPKRMTSPTNSRKKPPLTINITSSSKEVDANRAHLEGDNASPTQHDNDGNINGNAAAHDVGDSVVDCGSMTSGMSSTGSPGAFTRTSVLSQGSFQVPSMSELKQGMLVANSLPAPEVLLESIVQLRRPVMDDEGGDDLSSVADRAGGTRSRGSSSVGSVASGVTAGTAGSAVKSIYNIANGPHLLIKPILGVQSLSSSPVTVPGVNSRDSSPVRGSPDKSSPPKNGHGNTYVDQKGKLRVKDVTFEKAMLEVLHDIDVEKNAGMTIATLESQHSHSLTGNSVPLVPIKHPYLTMNGTKHVLPDKVLASLVQAQTRASQLDADSFTESVYLGNTSSTLIRDSTLSHTYDQSTGAIPWLPRGTLEPPEHDRSNVLLGKREKLALQRHFDLDANKQVLTIRSQNAIRGAFEEYVQKKLKQQHGQPAPFNQLGRAQQEALLQQYSARTPNEMGNTSRR